MCVASPPRLQVPGKGWNRTIYVQIFGCSPRCFHLTGVECFKRPPIGAIDPGLLCNCFCMWQVANVEIFRSISDRVFTRLGVEMDAYVY